jgi:hypothetical protein
MPGIRSLHPPDITVSRFKFPSRNRSNLADPISSQCSEYSITPGFAHLRVLEKRVSREY